MLKKENRGFFNLCCGFGPEDSQMSTTPPKIAHYRSNKDGKHSLKNITNRSSIPSGEELSRFPNAPNNKLSLLNQNSTLTYKNVREFQIQANATSHYRIDQKKKLKQKKICNFDENYAGLQRQPETNTKQTETGLISGKLQKTARKYTLAPKAHKTLPQILLQETKHTRESMIPMSLGQFKESLVSVYVENDQPPIIDESIIMIDYFHPNNYKQQEIASILRRPQ